MFMPVIFWFASSFMTFLPIHFDKIRNRVEADLKTLRDQYVSLYKRAKTE